MLNRAALIDKIADDLLKEEFEVFITQGCFDIAAKREKLMLIKCLTNIDGLNQGQAKSLLTISYFLSGYPFVVSMRNNRSFLANDIIYSRFELPVVTPKMFENIIEEEAHTLKSAKGRHTFEIDTTMLQMRRYELKFTLEELSKLVGISKKALYEIENSRTDPTQYTVKKLEHVLNVKLRKIYKPQSAEPAYMEPSTQLQKTVNKELSRIGVENTAVQHAPFEIAGKGEFSFITGLSKTSKKMKRVAISVKKLSGIFESSAFFVSNKRKNRTVEGLPILLEEDLPEIESAKGLKKLIEENSD